MGGLAARIAGARYLGLRIDRAAHAEELGAALGGLKGPLMKVAQLIATIPEALPDEYAAELGQLQSHAPAMGQPVRAPADDGRARARVAGPVRRVRARRRGRRLARPGPPRAAKDGRRLACKLQYPSIESAVEADLAQLRFVFGIYRRYDGSINHGADLRGARPSACARSWTTCARPGTWRSTGICCRDEPDVHVPEVVRELSTGRLLTMTWLDGRRSSSSWAPPRRSATGSPTHVPRLVRAILRLRA